jgi:hypothetical protein
MKEYVKLKLTTISFHRDTSTNEFIDYWVQFHSFFKNILMVLEAFNDFTEELYIHHTK